MAAPAIAHRKGEHDGRSVGLRRALARFAGTPAEPGFIRFAAPPP